MTIRRFAHVRVCVCVWVKANGCPRHLSGKLALLRALSVRAGEGAATGLRLHASAQNNLH